MYIYTVTDRSVEMAPANHIGIACAGVLYEQSVQDALEGKNYSSYLTVSERTMIADAFVGSVRCDIVAALIMADRCLRSTNVC